uniref:Nipsnap homolog 3A (C. elegans) n=1 Tax=Sinocyclocheilus anshuiensis TaxID=1608454 RepID=A0A671LSA5_9TELE
NVKLVSQLNSSNNDYMVSLAVCFTFPVQPKQHGTFYEFRTYYIQPHLNAVFLRLTNEEIHLWTAHSELIGYWSVEYGGLNQVPFRYFTCTASCLRRIWEKSLFSPELNSQDNEVTYLVPWSKIQKPPKDGVHVLWWYECADQRAAIRHKSHDNVRVVAAAYLVSQKNEQMFPCAFSPIK